MIPSSESRMNIFKQSLGPCFLLLYPFYRFLLFHDYPLWDPEVLLIVFVWIAFVMIGVTVASKNLGLLALIYALALYFFFTTGPDPLSTAGLIVRGVLALIVMLLLIKLQINIWQISLIFISGVLVADIGLLAWKSTHHQSSPVSVSAERSSHSKTDGPILHIILDEHIGVDGLPSAVPETAQMKIDFQNFFIGYGFTLFSKAYSPYVNSDNSISNILNLSYSEKDREYFKDYGAKSRKTLMHNALFKKFGEDGYGFHVYQPNYINFCQEGFYIESCDEVSRNSPIALMGAPYSFRAKGWVLLSLYLANNSFFASIEKEWVGHDIFKTRVGPLGAGPKIFDRLSHDLALATSHDYFFAHILMPHYPYVYDASCRPLPVLEWMDSRELPDISDSINTLDGYQARYSQYYDQIRCAHQLLGNIFNALKKNGLYDSTTIVIHGDHGSRINLKHNPDFESYSQISKDDMLTSYSTLLAIKKPQQKTGILNTKQDDVVAILKEVFLEEKVLSDENFVLLGQEKSRDLVRVPMPVF
jgi:hypothetical protein